MAAARRRSDVPPVTLHMARSLGSHYQRPGDVRAPGRRGRTPEFPPTIGPRDTRFVDVSSQPAPSNADAASEGGHGLDRLIFFSDAVVAIAITLVVLPLVDSARGLGARPVMSFLRDNSTGLIAAGISFAVIGGFWRDHHRLFTNATGYTPNVLRTNMFWLGGIMAVPVVTVLVVSGSGTDRLALGLYLGVILLVRILLIVEEILLARAGSLGSARVTPLMMLHHAIPAGLILIALLVTMSVPAWGIWPVLLLVLERPVRLFLSRIQDEVGHGQARADRIHR